MKRLVLSLTILLTMIAAAPLLAVDSSQRPTLAMDVVRLMQAGVADSAIIAFVQSHHGTYTVSADDMIMMANAKVSPEVMKIVADDAATRESAPPPAQAQSQTQAQPASTSDRDWREGGTVVEESAGTTVVVPAPRVYYDPWYYWDPYWYGPSLSVNLGWGYYGGYYYPYYPYYGHGGHYYGHNGGHYGGHPGGGHPGGGGGHPGGGRPGGGHPGGGGGHPGGGGGHPGGGGGHPGGGGGHSAGGGRIGR